MGFRVSLLITSYNRFDALELVLRTALRQSMVPDQIIICDDGSKPGPIQALRDLVRMLSPETSLVHVWQPDSSFRAARVRNLGLSRVSEPYLIMIDGDCLMPYRFIERHSALAAKGRVVAGGRYLISREWTEIFVETKRVDFSRLKSVKLLQVPMGRLRDLGSYRWEAARTCNLGLFLDDALRVDGLDESYVGWGLEDSDFVVRLLKSGVTIRSARFAAAVAHLHHPQAERAYMSKNEARFSSVIDDEKPHTKIRSCLVDE